MLTLYSATVFKVFIPSKSFLVESLNCSVISLTTSDTWISSPSVCMTLIPFSCFIALAGTSNAILNRSSKSKYLERKCFQFFPHLEQCLP